MPRNAQEELVVAARNENKDLAPLKFLIVDYKCDKWWFEIADMYRRVLFVGILPLVSRSSALRSSFGCLLAIISITFFREMHPYQVEFTNVIANVAQVYLSSYLFLFPYDIIHNSSNF